MGNNCVPEEDLRLQLFHHYQKMDRGPADRCRISQCILHTKFDFDSQRSQRHPNPG